MSMTDAEVNKFLRQVQALWGGDARKKGTPGERAALAALKRYKNLCRPSVIIHSFAYPYAKGEAGNIHLDDNGNLDFTTDRGQGQEEIDLVFITTRRVFLIEVKTYKRDNIKLTDLWEFYKGPVKKSVQSQTEKHARHFYYNFYEYFPDGKKEYIVPVIVFIDRCKVKDERSMKQKEAMPACILNNLNKIISVYDTPLQYAIDIDALLGAMLNKQFSNEGIIK